MSEEEIRKLARQSMLETIKTNLHSEMIFTYIKSLEDRIDKAINYVEDCEWEDYPIQTTTHHKLREEIIGKELLNILEGEQ